MVGNGGIHRNMDKKIPLVSIITVNYNGKQFLNDCLGSLLDLNYPKDKLEIFMVDNGSNDGSVDYVKNNFPTVKIILNSENNYAKANNLGIKSAKGEYIALINNDVKADKDWLIVLVKTAESNIAIGALGSKILFKDGFIQSVGHQGYPNYYWGDIGFREEDRGQYNIEKEVVSICGCSVLYRKKCLEDVGLLDEDFNMYLEDVDMAIRCRNKKWKIVSCPQSIIHHKFHSTIGSEDNARYWQEKNRLLLIAKHWPEKLADALFGKGYFTIINGHSNTRDISEIIGKVLNKLLKEHGYETLNRLSTDLFESIRIIYNFEKNYLIQNITNERGEKNNLIIELDTLKKESLKLEQILLSLKQQKDQELASLSEQKDQELTLLKQEKDRELASLSEQKDQELTLLKQEKDQELMLLRQERALETDNNNLLLGQVRKELNDIYSSTGYRYFLRPFWIFLWSIKIIFKRIKNITELAYPVKLKEILKNRPVFMRFYYSDSLLAKIMQTISRRRNPWLKAYQRHLKNSTFPPRPEALILMLTKRCNLDCVFCDIHNSNEEMKVEDAIKVIDNANRLGIRWLVITGGEPFLHKGLFDIIEYAKSLNLKISITTNGSLIDNAIDKIRRSRVDLISVSLDGIGKTHDSLRKNDGLYEKVKNNILELKKNKQDISINFVVTNKNVHELEEIYNWAKKEKIVIDFWPVNFHEELYIIQKEDREIFLTFVKKLKKNREISNYKYYYYLNSVFYSNNNNHLKVRCLGLTKSLGVYVNGDILTCCVWEKEKARLGNAIREDLESLWCSKEYWKVRDFIYTKGCSAGCYNTSLQEFMSVTGEDFMLPIKKIPKRG
jgi:GT2 family glycosyltransferase/MoaA/NifB/PqqE/SkfB family radical SAM enzyme